MKNRLQRTLIYILEMEVRVFFYKKKQKQVENPSIGLFLCSENFFIEIIKHSKSHQTKKKITSKINE